MKTSNHRVAYLACPYSHSENEVRQARLALVNRVAFDLHQQGKFVYSPLTHNLTLIESSDHQSNWQIWEAFNKTMIAKCDELIVITAEGWDSSQGVAAEIAFAKEFNKPIEMLAPEEIEIS